MIDFPWNRPLHCFLREIALWPLLIRKNTITNQPLGQEWNYCPSGTQNYCPRGFATWAIMSSFGAIISFLPAWLVSNSILLAQFCRKKNFNPKNFVPKKFKPMTSYSRTDCSQDLEYSPKKRYPMQQRFWLFLAKSLAQFWPKMSSKLSSFHEWSSLYF